MTVAPGERMSQKEIDTLSQSLSQNAQLGGFGKQQWIAAISEIGTVSSRQKSFNRDSWEFIGRMSNLGGMEPAQAAKVYGSIAHANPKMNDAQIQQVLLAGIGIGREETFNVGEIPEAGGVVQSGYKIGGEDRQHAMNQAFGLAGLIKPHTKSGTLSEAGTNEEALLRAMEGVSRMGNTNIKTNNLGQVTNMGEALRYVLTTPENLLPKHLTARKESEEAINALKIESGITTTDSKAQAGAKIDAMLEKFDKLGISMDQFITENDEATGVEQKLKARFNELAGSMENRLLKLLENGEFQKAFDNVINVLIASAPLLDMTLRALVEAFNWGTPKILAFFDVLTMIAKAIVGAVDLMGISASSKMLDSFATELNNTRQQLSLYNQFKDVEYPADFTGPLPPGASQTVGKQPVPGAPQNDMTKKQEKANGHLEKIVNSQDKQVQILEDIRKNTKNAPHGPPAPDRSHNG